MSGELQQIRDIRAAGRREFAREVGVALTDISLFGHALADVLGEVSRDEAVDALKRKAIEAIERMR